MLLQKNKTEREIEEKLLDVGEGGKEGGKRIGCNQQDHSATGRSIGSTGNKEGVGVDD